MNDSAAQRLRELLWRRKLSDAEAAELQNLLSTHPEARADWEIESALNQALDHLPEAPPVATNFTALVLQAAERESKIRTHTDSRWSLPRWLPKFAAAALALTASVAIWHHHEASERAAMARDVAQLGAALEASTPELTQNFESIRRLGEASPKADTDLLALMQ
jgi:hypothetical protein